MRDDEKSNVYPSDLQGRDRSPITLKTIGWNSRYLTFRNGGREGEEKTVKTKELEYLYEVTHMHQWREREGVKKRYVPLWLFFFKKS